MVIPLSNFIRVCVALLKQHNCLAFCENNIQKNRTKATRSGEGKNLQEYMHVAKEDKSVALLSQYRFALLELKSYFKVVTFKLTLAITKCFEWKEREAQNAHQKRHERY